MSHTEDAFELEQLLLAIFHLQNIEPKHERDVPIMKKIISFLEQGAEKIQKGATAGVAWSYILPTKPGVYWCKQAGNLRVVTVGCYVTDPTKLFTNEDGGVSLSDAAWYKDAQWSEDITPPKA